MSRLGLHISADEAAQVVKYYDREGAHGRYGDNEIAYEDLVDDVTKVRAKCGAPALRRSG